MGELHAFINLTLDGCCDHTQVIADDELHDWATDLLSGAAAGLMGRVTYEMMRSYWPGVAASGAGAAAEVRFARVLETKPKYVVSRRDLASGWSTTRIALDPKGDSIRALKRATPGTLLLGASPRLAAALAQAGLIDEYHLAIQPIVAGHGPTYLAGLTAPARLQLRAATQFRSGVTVHRYRVETAAPAGTP